MARGVEKFSWRQAPANAKESSLTPARGLSDNRAEAKIQKFENRFWVV